MLAGSSSGFLLVGGACVGSPECRWDLVGVLHGPPREPVIRADPVDGFSQECDIRDVWWMCKVHPAELVWACLTVDELAQDTPHETFREQNTIDHARTSF